MTKVIEAGSVKYIAATPGSGNSAFTVLTPQDIEFPSLARKPFQI